MATVQNAVTQSSDANGVTFIVIEPEGSNPVVQFDGTESFDPDGDPITYTRSEGDAILSSLPAPEIQLEVGSHSISLAVTDDKGCNGTQTIAIDVITSATAVENLLVTLANLEIPRKRQLSLITNLKSALSSFDRGSFRSGVNQLQAFQNKVMAQLKDNPALVQQLIDSAQDIIDAMLYNATPIQPPPFGVPTRTSEQELAFNDVCLADAQCNYRSIRMHNGECVL